MKDQLIVKGARQHNLKNIDTADAIIAPLSVHNLSSG